jgi:hypothetical protein
MAVLIGGSTLEKTGLIDQPGIAIAHSVVMGALLIRCQKTVFVFRGYLLLVWVFFYNIVI